MFGSFDRLGFLLHKRSFRPSDLDVDLTGRAFLVTGANSGLGYHTAAGLAERGARLLLLCRDPARGEAARDALQRQTQNPHIEARALDLSDLESVRRFAGSFSWPVIDGLIHNAGLLPASRQLSPQGQEITFATHVLGPHLLTALLRPQLRASRDARVIFVSSGGMYSKRLSLDDLAWVQRRYDGVAAYAQTKRMQVILASLWDTQLGEGTVRAHSMHPGWAETPGVKTSLPRFYQLTRAVLRSPEEGADTVLWLAACARLKGQPGAFWFDRAPRSPYWFPWTREEPSARDAFWSLCQKLTGAPR